MNFQEHRNIIWGKKCENCGHDVYLLQQDYHPWGDKEFAPLVTCPKCQQKQIINKEQAAIYYSRKIYSFFDIPDGVVLDLGCGGGFLSSKLIQNSKITKIFAVDYDQNVQKSIESIKSPKIKFINQDADHLENNKLISNVDYLVHRDLFMFISNTENYFNYVRKSVSKSVYHMGWFIRGSERMKNQLLPEEIKEKYLEKGFEVSIKYPDWYSCGYFIRADRK